MLTQQRSQRILAIIDRKGFASVKELSETCGVSEMTIRRDLEQLDKAGRARRTYGGAFPAAPAASEAPPVPAPEPQPAGYLPDRVDVLITTPVDPKIDRVLLDRAERKGIPIIAESTEFDGNTRTVIAVDNFTAAAELGRWAGHYAAEHFGGRAAVLDLTFPLKNTQARSSGFMTGLCEVLPGARLVVSLNAQSTAAAAHQLTLAALDVHREINLIFAINDAIATGALRACYERGVPPDKLLVLSFGLEGDTLRDAVFAGGYCRAGLAMFPEIVGPAAIEAAIAAFNQQPLPRYLATPYAILTPANLCDFYEKTKKGWQLRWDTISGRVSLPFPIDPRAHGARSPLPRRVGFVVPFMEHEWYRNLINCMRSYASRLGIEFEAVDAVQLLNEDAVLRQRHIAQVAVAQIGPGEVILIDGSPINTCLAQELAGRSDITVITNSLPVFEALRNEPGITLILTGGTFWRPGEILTGPSAAAALRELRADKLFLGIAGITLKFGLSCGNLGEVPVKQAMIRAARDVILLADHTRFGQEGVGQIAPITAVHRLITDNALPSSMRLELSKLGVEVIIADTRE